MNDCILDRVSSERGCKHTCCGTCGWNRGVHKARTHAIRNGRMSEDKDGIRLLRVNVRHYSRVGNRYAWVDSNPNADA